MSQWKTGNSSSFGELSTNVQIRIIVLATFIVTNGICQKTFEAGVFVIPYSA